MRVFQRLTASLLIILLLTSATASASSSVLESAPDASETLGAAPGRLLVKMADNRTAVRALSSISPLITGMSEICRLPAQVSALGGTGTGRSGAVWYTAKLKEGTDLELARAELIASGQVLTVEYDYIRKLNVPIPIEAADPFEAQQDYLDYIGTSEDQELPGYGVLVAVLDTGIDNRHPDLKDQIVVGGRRYFVGGSGNAEWDDEYQDKNGHGTHVAGIIAAAKNGIGMVGVAPGANILPVKVLNDNGSGFDSAIAAGMDYALERSARVINMSFGGTWSGSLYSDLADKAKDKGCLIVAAVGNEAMPTSSVGDSYYNSRISPANESKVLSVMAMNLVPNEAGDYLSGYSNWDSDPLTGTEYQIMAPGEALSTFSGRRYAVLSGTSVAAPITSGAAAVLIADDRTISADGIWDKLVSGGDRLQGRTHNGTVYSYPALNLAKSLEWDGTAAPTLTVSAESALTNPIQIGSSELTPEGEYVNGVLLADSEGTLVSDLIVRISNYTGIADSVSLSAPGFSYGFITETADESGNAVIEVSETKTLGIGESAVAELTPSGKISGNRLQTALTVTYKDSAGEEFTPITSELDFEVIRTALPDGLTTDTAGHYRLSQSALTLKPGTLWCLDKPLYIESGKSMILSPGAKLYIGPDAEIIIDGGTFEAKGTAEEYSSIMSNAAIKNREGRSSFEFCVISEPHIEAADTILNCRVEGMHLGPVEITDESVLNEPETPEVTDTPNVDSPPSTAPEGAGLPETGDYLLEADTIWRTELLQLWKIRVRARDFTQNLMDSCIGATLEAQKISSCTFRENLLMCPELYGFYENMCLTVVTPDADGSSGFFSNCVAGPVKIYSVLDLPSKTAVFAKVKDVYYMGVGARVLDIIPTLTDTDDKLYCSPESEIITDSPVAGCPAFPISITALDTKYGSDGVRIITRLLVEFSGRMDPESSVYCVSLLSGIYTGLEPLQPEEIEWARDGRSCIVNIYTSPSAQTAQNYVFLSGFTPERLPMMRLGEFNYFKSPLLLRFIAVLEVFARDVGDGVLLEWHPPRGEDYTHYSVQRSTDSVSYTEIYSAESGRFARNGDLYRYSDIDTGQNTRYYYQIEGYSVDDEGVRRRLSTGRTDVIRGIVGETLTLSKSEVYLRGHNTKNLTLTAGSSMQFDELTFDLVTEGAAFGVLDVSDIMTTVHGAPLGVSLIDEHTVRVTVGYTGEIYKLVSGQTLAGIKLGGNNAAGSGSVSIANVDVWLEGVELDFILGESCTVTSAPRAGTGLPVPDGGPGTVLIGSDGGQIPMSYMENGVLYARSDPGSSAKAVNLSQTFSDVGEDHWARDAVDFVSARRLFGAVEADRFEPAAPMTQAMLVTVLHRLENPVSHLPADMPYYSTALDWASERGIVERANFIPEGIVTREMLAAILHSYSAGRIPGTGTLAQFSDAADISEWAQEALEWAAAADLIRGRSGDKLEPAAATTRAEVAAVIMRLVSELV